MKSEEFKNFLNDEIKEIKKYREEQMKKGKDPDESVIRWVQKYAKSWREKWFKNKGIKI